MIRIQPPLKVMCAGKSALLTELSATHAVLEYAWEPIKGERGTIELTIGSSRFMLSYKVNSDNRLEFNSESLPIALDLLHIVRKGQHIDLCVTQDVEHSTRANGFDQIDLPVVSLPETSWDEVSLQTKFMGHLFSAPFLITGMTGGIAQASVINERLARAASTLHIPMGVGSQRLALENDEHSGIFKLKRHFPHLFLIGNIGIGQLIRSDYLDLCNRAVEMIDANALAIHVNVLQELIQVEGDRDFRGIIDKIGRIQEDLHIPILVKEVGAGLDASTASKLYERGVRHFDVGGAGGTSWAHIEGLRSSHPMIQRRGQIFRDWGLSTAAALKTIHGMLPDAELVATGGIRNGLIALKALYTGATITGIGLPLLRAATASDDAPLELLHAFCDELKIAKICSGIL
jgi:isopentenyl-diphosphate Delta-isomerase